MTQACRLRESVSGFGPETRVSDMICVLAIIKHLVRGQTCVATVFDCALWSSFSSAKIPNSYAIERYK